MKENCLHKHFAAPWHLWSVHFLVQVWPVCTMSSSLLPSSLSYFSRIHSKKDFKLAMDYKSVVANQNIHCFSFKDPVGSFCLEIWSVILQLNHFQYRNIKVPIYSGGRMTVSIGLILHPGKQAVSDNFFFIKLSRAVNVSDFPHSHHVS